MLRLLVVDFFPLLRGPCWGFLGPFGDAVPILWVEKRKGFAREEDKRILWDKGLGMWCSRWGRAATPSKEGLGWKGCHPFGCTRREVLMNNH